MTDQLVNELWDEIMNDDRQPVAAMQKEIEALHALIEQLLDEIADIRWSGGRANTTTTRKRAEV